MTTSHRLIQLKADLLIFFFLSENRVWIEAWAQANRIPIRDILDDRFFGLFSFFFPLINWWKLMTFENWSPFDETKKDGKKLSMKRYRIITVSTPLNHLVRLLADIVWQMMLSYFAIFDPNRFSWNCLRWSSETSFCSVCFLCCFSTWEPAPPNQLIWRKDRSSFCILPSTTAFAISVSQTVTAYGLHFT